MQVVKPANPQPCAHCPWRLANQGQSHPHGFYTKRNLGRLWTGLRRGARMSCHPTDPRMSEFEGYEDTANRATTCECTGALVIIQRELVKATHFAREAQKRGVADGWMHYRAQSPHGLTQLGLLEHVGAMAFCLPGELSVRLVHLINDEIGYPPLGDFDPADYPQAA